MESARAGAGRWGTGGAAAGARGSHRVLIGFSFSAHRGLTAAVEADTMTLSQSVHSGPLSDLAPDPPPAPAPRTDAAAPGGRAHVAYVLLVLQAALEMLATLGMVALMGPAFWHWLLPLAHIVTLLVLASRVARGRRWAWRLVAIM